MPSNLFYWLLGTAENNAAWDKAYNYPAADSAYLAELNVHGSVKIEIYGH